ncbi:glycosyltransferase [Saccharophagus sp. K07]|jgi:glycosyltransferase involved in cell wall biosynthesis|uniref:glycosyltransferase family 2 protein n=1 Tax=Saccharophagus sp. K07 TaxID=2283636 RepID=UPI0016525A9A|nr:glycosyltransferase family 2 protein [Saccharophagus sp. K07]MBC6905977.1 glycosyltransferase [Saccharophagus sp. K07]
MQLSVIISTYNSPEWLEKVLWGYSCQTFQDFEIIIADDGSDQRTVELLNRMRVETGLDIRHVWQQDKGFRKCRILNKAITQARYDYLVFTDGDCIPRRDFLQVHAEEARPGHYLSGGYFKLPMSTSKAITKDDIFSGRCFSVSWLREHGLSFWRKSYKIGLNPSWAKVFNHLTTTKCNLKGSNASVWKADALKVNGFDERMPWGGEDREFGVRLINSGIKPKHVRFNAIVIHLDHSRGYIDPERVKANRELRIANEKNKVTTTEFGIRQLGDKD